MTLVARANPILWLRKLYDWVMKWSEHPSAIKFLCVLAFVESIFFPIPVDPFIMSLGAANPRKALWYGFIAAVFSVLGGIFAYFLGYWFWETTQSFFFNYVISVEKFDLVIAKFGENAFWAMFLAGFTPIPFKVFTLAAGVANIAFAPFLLGSFISRTLRFCIEGGLIFWAGPQIRTFIEKHFEKITLVTGLIIILILVVYNLTK